MILVHFAIINLIISIFVKKYSNFLQVADQRTNIDYKIKKINDFNYYGRKTYI